MHKSFGHARGAARHRPRRRRARGRLPDRRVGLRASRRCCAASTCSSRSTRAGSSSRARRSPRRGVDVNRVRRRIGIVFQAYNLFPHMTRAAQRHARADARRSDARAREAEARARRAARALRARRQARRVSGPPLRRPAAARRDRARARDAARPDAARRGDERARSGARRRGARGDPRARRGRDDDADRDARDELRARHRRPDLLPRRRRDPRAGPAGADPQRAAASRGRSSSSSASSRPAGCETLSWRPTTSRRVDARREVGHRDLVDPVGGDRGHAEAPVRARHRPLRRAAARPARAKETSSGCATRTASARRTCCARGSRSRTARSSTTATPAAALVGSTTFRLGPKDRSSSRACRSRRSAASPEVSDDTGPLRADRRRPRRLPRAAPGQRQAVLPHPLGDRVDDARADDSRGRLRRARARRREPVPAALDLRRRRASSLRRAARSTSRSGTASRTASARRGATRSRPRSSTAAESALERQLSRELMAGREAEAADSSTRARRSSSRATTGDELYLLLDGVLVVEVDGEEVVEVGPGAIVGERARSRKAAREPRRCARAQPHVSRCFLPTRFDREALADPRSGAGPRDVARRDPRPGWDTLSRRKTPGEVAEWLKAAPC